MKPVVLLVGLMGCWLACVREGAAGEAPAPAGPKAGIHRLSLESPASLKQLLSFTAERLPLVSAHRGGSGPGLPENCLETFQQTLTHTHALIEVDPRYTRDGVIVLHHDPTLDRTTTGSGKLIERTYDEVKSLRLRDSLGNETPYSIPTLAEAIEWARGRAVLILDQKDVPVEARVAKVTEHRAESYVMLIVYSYEDARTCFQLNPDIMMEVMVPSLGKMQAFEKTGVPWRNVIAFVGHDPPASAEILEKLHERGVLCVAGTSRNLDRQVLQKQVSSIEQLRPDYHRLLEMGVDLLETDLPREVAPLLFRTTTIPPSRQHLMLLRSE